MTKKRIKRPEWIPLLSWNRLLYEIWKIMAGRWELFYRYDILQKIYFYLVGQLSSGVVITGYTIHLPYSNKGSMICIHYRCLENIQRVLEVTIDSNKELVSHQHDLSENRK